MHARNGSAEGCDVPMTASLHSSKRSYCTHTTSRLAGLTVSPVASTAPPVQPLKIVRYEKRWGMTSHTYFVYIRTLLCGILSLALFTDGGAKVGFRVLLSTIYKRYLSANFVSGIRIYTIYRLCVCVCVLLSRGIGRSSSRSAGGVHGNRNTRRHACRPFTDVFYVRD